MCLHTGCVREEYPFLKHTLYINLVFLITTIVENAENAKNIIVIIENKLGPLKYFQINVGMENFYHNIYYLSYKSDFQIRKHRYI